MKREFSKRIEIIIGDITKLNCDAIVNAANSSLYGGGGVDGAIHKAGGKTILEACKVIRETSCPNGLLPGGAVLTTAGNMPASYVIHTVGPIWHGGKENEEKTLADSYRNCLAIATKNKFKTIAFPAISTGVYGFPKKLASKIALNAIEAHVEKNIYPEKVSLVFFSKSDKDIFLNSTSVY